MNKLKAFIERNPQISGLFVSPDGGSWFNDQIPGYTWMSREEILGEDKPTTEEPKEESKTEITNKKKKK